MLLMSRLISESCLLPQPQPKVLESDADWRPDIRFAKLLLEESATGSHDHPVNVDDVMIPADDV